VNGRPLAGVRVVVTRPRTQAASLVGALEDLGAVAVPVPVIEITDPPDGGAALRAGLQGLENGDWIVVTSPNGAARVAAALRGCLLERGVSVAAIGPGTKRQAETLGLRVDLVPSSSIAEGLLDYLPGPRAGGGTMLLARAESARSVLPDGLRARGWTVKDVAAYRTVGLPVAASDVTACRHADVVAFTSASTVSHLVAGVGASNLPPIVACIGTATAARARELGLRVDVSAAEHTIPGLVSAISDAIPQLVLLRPEPVTAAESRWMLEQYEREIGERFAGEPARAAATRREPDGPDSSDDILIAARLAGAPVGCGILTFADPGVADITHMWISRRVRSRGVGRRLLRRLVAEAAGVGARRVRLETNERLTEAIGLYRSEGFVEVAAVDADPHTDHRFVLDLGAPPADAADAPLW
jgi:uroporphyrinogen-III synthase/ribosomal protein S18 acetylase RimI-like enzyme